MKARMTPQEAGRKGGLIGGHSRSAAKLAACRRNGFQRTAPTPDAEQEQAAPLIVHQPAPIELLRANAEQAGQ